jgi:CBS domain-containing protein
MPLPLQDETAATLMTPNVISVLPGDTVPEIAAKLTRHNISGAPVIDSSGKLLGIVSEGDLIRAFGARSAAKPIGWLDMLAEGKDFAKAFLDDIRHDSHKASEIMTRDVITAQEDTSLPEIADLLSMHGVKRVPILRGEHVVGIVSRADIVHALARKPAA